MNYKTATIEVLVNEYFVNKDWSCYEEIFNRVQDFVKRYNDVYRAYNGCPYYFEPTTISTFDLQFEGEVVKGYLPDDAECLFAFPYCRIEITTQQIAAELIEKEESLIKELTTTLEKRKTLLEEFKKKEFQ